MKKRNIIITIIIVLLIIISSLLITFNKTKFTGNVVYNQEDKLYSHLVNYWDFEGNYLDKKGANSGYIEGIGTSSFKNSESSQSLSLDNKYIHLTGTANSVSTLPESSISAWIKISSLPGVQTIYGEGNSDGITYALNINQGKPSLWNWRNDRTGNWAGVTSETRLQPGQWYHIVGTFGNSGMKIYMDGNLDNAISENMPANAEVVRAYIGSQYQTSFSSSWGHTSRWVSWINQFNGELDDLMIFDKELSSEEIKQIYDNKRLTPQTSSLTAKDVDESSSINGYILHCEGYQNVQYYSAQSCSCPSGETWVKCDQRRNRSNFGRGSSTTWITTCNKLTKYDTRCMSSPVCPDGLQQIGQPSTCSIDLPSKIVSADGTETQLLRYDETGAIKVKHFYSGLQDPDPDNPSSIPFNLKHVIIYSGERGSEKPIQKITFVTKIIDGVETLIDNYILDYNPDGITIESATLHVYYYYDRERGNNMWAAAEEMDEKYKLHHSIKYRLPLGSTEEAINFEEILKIPYDELTEFVHYPFYPNKRMPSISRESDRGNWNITFSINPNNYQIYYRGYGHGNIFGTDLGVAEFKTNSVYYLNQIIADDKRIGYYRIANSSNFDLTDLDLNLVSTEVLFYNYTVFGNEPGKLDTLYLIGNPTDIYSPQNTGGGGGGTIAQR